jgi:hypothetical protein
VNGHWNLYIKSTSIFLYAVMWTSKERIENHWLR